MSLPASVTTITVTATSIVDLVGTPTTDGDISFLPTSVTTLVVTDANTLIAAGTKIVTLDTVTGGFTVALPATNDPDVSPSGWYYTVVLRITGEIRRVWYVELPYNSPGGAVNFVDVITTETPGGLATYITAADLAAVSAAVTALSASLGTAAIRDIGLGAGDVAAGNAPAAAQAAAETTAATALAAYRDQATPNAFFVEWPGAGVDATAAIQAAINTAVTSAVADGSNYAEIWLEPRVYTLSSATTKSSINKGNAQLYLPIIGTGDTKFVLVLRGTRSAGALPHWQQTDVQDAGCVLKTTLTGQSVDGTYGPPSVVGGPTPAQGYGFDTATFNNMLIVVDGVSILTPANPTVLGFDFSGMAEVHVISASANASVTPGTGLPALCTSSWAYGLYAPQMLNNDLCDIWQWSCEGFYSGITLCEHAVVQSLRAIYCAVGVTVVGRSSDSVLIGYASVEACPIVMQAVPINGGTGIDVHCQLLDVEDTFAAPFTFSKTIDDGSNILRGVINVHELSGAGVQGADPVVNGGTYVKVINLGTGPGASAVPALPASGVASTPVYRDAYIWVTGGTVSAAAIDGIDQGITATGFPLLVPSGKTFAITYSVAPTIKVTLL